jgi:hypothetical protein
MRRFGFLIAAGAIGFGSLTMSCSHSVTKADFKAELDKEGLGSSADTQCLVDKLESSGFQFRDRGDLSADDQTKITDAVSQCASPAALTTPTS